MTDTHWREMALVGARRIEPGEAIFPWEDIYLVINRDEQGFVAFDGEDSIVDSICNEEGIFGAYYQIFRDRADDSDFRERVGDPWSEFFTIRADVPMWLVSVRSQPGGYMEYEIEQLGSTAEQHREFLEQVAPLLAASISPRKQFVAVYRCWSYKEEDTWQGPGEWESGSELIGVASASVAAKILSEMVDYPRDLFSTIEPYTMLRK